MKEQANGADLKGNGTDRIHFTQLAAYGAGGIIPIALFNIAGILVGLMGNISLGLSAFWLGVILIIPRLWDALSDPVIGHLSDNTRTRWGRRRPFLLVGGILVALLFVMIWWIPKGDLVRNWFPTDTGYHWFQLVYILISLLLFFTAVNIFEIPHGALGMEMTTDYHERTRLFSAKSFVGNLFAMSTPWLFALANMEIFRGPGGNEADGMRYVSLMIAAILIPLAIWWTVKLREPGFVRASRQEKTPFWTDMKRTAGNRNFILLTLTIFTLAMGFNFVQLLGSYIPIFYVFGGDKVAGAKLLGINGTIWAITGLLAVFPLNWLSPKMGKRKTLILAILLMIAAQLSKIVCYNPEMPFLIIIPTILLSAGMLFFFTLGSSMVGDICDEDELKTGYRAEGSFYAIFWWFIKMGTALASFVAGALIVLTQFDEGQVTRVDRFQGAIREVRASAVYWVENPADRTKDALSLENYAEHLKETWNKGTEYVKVLEKEATKESGNKMLLLEMKSRLDRNLEELMNIRRQIAPGAGPLTLAQTDSLMSKAIPLDLDILRIKAINTASELNEHLKSRHSLKAGTQEHYERMLQKLGSMRQKIEGMDLEKPIENTKVELDQLSEEVIGLTRQTPFTLLMMRVVEIGVPVLLSLLSLIFIFRYSLTEKRSREIREQIKIRQSETIA